MNTSGSLVSGSAGDNVFVGKLQELNSGSGTFQSTSSWWK
jgi:hypothetical protein